VKFKSTLFAQTSGSLAGTTFSHNRGGMYTRARATPTNPNTPQQQNVRGYMSQLTSYWLSQLSAAQRTAWDTYAEQVPIIDRLGEPRNIGGLAMFVRCNSFRLGAGLAIVDDGPTTFTLGEYTVPTLSTLDSGAQTFLVLFDTGDDWVGEDGAMMRLFTSRAQNASVNYFKGPYRAADAIAGDSGTPPTSPFTSGVAFPFVAGQRVFVRLNVTRADGRLGSQFRGYLLAT